MRKCLIVIFFLLALMPAALWTQGPAYCRRQRMGR